jgi:hypothetical protein
MNYPTGAEPRGILTNYVTEQSLATRSKGTSRQSLGVFTQVGVRNESAGYRGLQARGIYRPRLAQVSFR